MAKKILRALLLIGVLFFAGEFALHWFGLPVLEHDKIFLPTHDRYIGIFGLTYAALLALIATDIQKYRHLFIVTMLGILISMGNAYYIKTLGGYKHFFATLTLDSSLRVMGFSAVAWHVATWAVWYWQWRKSSA